MIRVCAAVVLFSWNIMIMGGSRPASPNAAESAERPWSPTGCRPMTPVRPVTPSVRNSELGVFFTQFELLDVKKVSEATDIVRSVIAHVRNLNNWYQREMLNQAKGLSRYRFCDEHVTQRMRVVEEFKKKPIKYDVAFTHKIQQEVVGLLEQLNQLVGLSSGSQVNEAVDTMLQLIKVKKNDLDGALARVGRGMTMYEYYRGIFNLLKEYWDKDATSRQRAWTMFEFEELRIAIALYCSELKQINKDADISNFITLYQEICSYLEPKKA